MGSAKKAVYSGLLVAAVWVHCAPRVDILGLFQQAGSPNPRMAADAQNRIDQLILERRVDLFQEVLRNGDDDGRGLALIFLGRIGTPEAVAVLVEYLALETRFLVYRDPITAVRRVSETDSRYLVARLLSLLGPPEGAVEKVLPALASSDPDERGMAIIILETLGEPSAALHLLPFAEDPDPHIERRAVEALGRLKNPIAVPVLLDRATQPQAPSRQIALSVLQRFRDPVIPERLLEVYPQVEEPGIRFAMISLLGRFPDSRVVPVLIGALSSSDPNLRRMAESRLCELTHRPPGKSPENWRKWWEEHRPDYRFPS